ncbi:MAG: hypothetical protein BMS9Abin29_0682 [Gemmatimonadota bacterium]|nr:MAG: hypothetical protein BMS9Abin29_0682 [Gemmatimonadota bacterium]
MAAGEPQNYGNHRRFVPTYHFLIAPILLLNLGWMLYQLVVAFSMSAVVAFLLAIALISMFLHLRLFPLAAQDRLIRLEERLRLERLLPHEQRHRIVDLSVNQLIALRFASDAEVGDLALAVLDEGLDDREAIKRRITDWRPDYQRV